MGLDSATKQRLACIANGEGPLGRGFPQEARYAVQDDDAEQLATTVIALGQRVLDLERASHGQQAPAVGLV